MNSRGRAELRTLRRNANAISATGPARAAPRKFPYFHGTLQEHDRADETALREQALLAAELLWKRQGV